MQRCSLILKKRKRGPDVWLLRWSDKSASGRRIYRKRVIGTVEEFVDAGSARRAVASLVEKINGNNPRHTYSTLLRSVGTEFKVMQELLRHSSLRSTLDFYTQAITPAKLAAQAAVMSLVFSPQAESPSGA